MEGLDDYSVVSRSHTAEPEPPALTTDTIQSCIGELTVEPVDWSAVNWSNLSPRRFKLNESETMEKFKLFLTKEPFKTYRKAGITNGDNILTDDGVKIFLTYLLDKNPEFVEVAKELVAEDK